VEAGGDSLKPSKQSRPHRRHSAHRRTSRTSRLGWRTKLLVAVCLAGVLLLACGAIVRKLAPTANTTLERFDTLIVLSAPSDDDGNPTPEEQARVTEAVHEYERGVAPRMIITGGAVSNRFVESEVMARSARAMGMPASAILVEPVADDTIQNARLSVRIMREHGWQSAEVITTSHHLPRAGLFFNRLPILWKVHLAPQLEPESFYHSSKSEVLEILKTVRFLVWRSWAEPYLP
jgi:uncharacterized SAM-binding protein YcdF (DUF218 family)